MNALLLARSTAASVTLIAGLLACAVRFGPAVAPEQHEATMIRIAAAFGEDIGPAPVVMPAVYVVH